MTDRQVYAVAAMQSLLLDPEFHLQVKSICSENQGSTPEGVVAHFSFKQADAMIAAEEAET
jgi:hypothetical protein